MPDDRPVTVFSWECRVAGSEIVREVVASSRGRAKVRYLRDYLSDLDIPFTAIRCRCLGQAHAPRGERLREVARKRGMDFVHPGMRIEVDGKMGRVWDGNDSGNFDVMFDDLDFAVNCHPHWKSKYFDGQGNLIKEYA